VDGASERGARGVRGVRALRDGGGTADGVFANRARACGAYRRRGFRHAKVDGGRARGCGNHSGGVLRAGASL
jgi:hypothetical protein